MVMTDKQKKVAMIAGVVVAVVIVLLIVLAVVLSDESIDSFLINGVRFEGVSVADVPVSGLTLNHRLAACDQLCSGRADCDYFEYSDVDRVCRLKRVTRKIDGFAFGVMNELGEWTVQVGSDLWGYDVAQKSGVGSVEDCKTVARSAGGNAFVYEAGRKLCWVKRGDGVDGVVMGVKGV